MGLFGRGKKEKKVEQEAGTPEELAAAENQGGTATSEVSGPALDAARAAVPAAPAPKGEVGAGQPKQAEEQAEQDPLGAQGAAASAEPGDALLDIFKKEQVLIASDTASLAASVDFVAIDDLSAEAHSVAEELGIR